jgi:hypothetical protein
MDQLRNLEALVQEEEQKQKRKLEKEENSNALRAAIKDTKSNIRKAFSGKRHIPARLKVTRCA